MEVLNIMENLVYFNKFYLDKEKDIIINLYKSNTDEITYILETPNHNTGNLITNLAKICNVETIKNEKDMKIIKGTIPASINGDNEEVYIFRLGGIKIANIYKDKIEIKAKIPAIIKTLMSQTKNYKLPIEKSIVKTYILKKSKFRTDLHTHMNANLSPDCLIALGIVHQIKYPLYYIKKINLKLTKKQEEKIYKQREKIEKQFENSELKGKYLIRKIDDNTFINFADFILNNENAQYNIEKIRTIGFEKNHQLYDSYGYKFGAHMWGVSSGKRDSRILEHLKMTINIEEGEEFIINRLMREKRCGTVTRANESTVEFEADVYSAQEMMPWIRTFIGRIEKLECSNHAVEKVFYDDLEAMYSMYQGEKNDI